MYYQLMCLKPSRWVANIADPDETPRSAASHRGLHCFAQVCIYIIDTFGVIYGTLDYIDVQRNPWSDCMTVWADLILHC